MIERYAARQERRPQVAMGPSGGSDAPNLQNASLTAITGRVSRTRLWPLPLVVLVSAALCLPFVRIIFSLGDEGVLLHGAQRMLQGERLYVDFFEFLPPGGFVLTELWLRVAGMSMLAVRTLVVITIAGIAGFTFLACREASRNAALSACLTIAWVMLSQGVWTQLSHHWITTLFSMAGVWAALVYAREPDRGKSWPLIAGTTFGAAAMVTPTCGALAMLAALTVFIPLSRHRAALAAYGFAGALVPIGLLLSLVWHRELVAAFNDVIVWTAIHYSPVQGLPYGHFANILNEPNLYVFPLAAVLTLGVCVAKVRDRTLVPCVAFALAGFVACYPRPDVFHISYEVPLALPLLASGAIRLTETWHYSYRATAFGVVAGLLSPGLLGFLWIAIFLSGLPSSETPRGEVAFYKLDGAPQLLARIAAEPRGDKWFFYATIPLLPFLAGREDVSRYDIITPEYTPPAQWQEVCESVMRHADWIVIDRRGTTPAKLKEGFPAMRDPQPPETRAFEQALDANFVFVARDGIFELRHRRVGIDDAVCAAVTGQILSPGLK